jgi:site-specific recombinase XerD
MNVNEIIKNYLESLRVRHFEALTVVGRHAVLRDFAGWLATAGVTDLREVTRHTVADYVRHLLRRLAANTVRTYQVCLRDFFAHLENTDAILLNPAGAVPYVQVENLLPRRILTPGEVRKLIDAPDLHTLTGLRDRAIFELFYSCGIRRHEIHKLTLSDVDIKNGFVRVNLGKGGKDRVVPIGENACQALGRYLAKARSVWFKARRNGPTDAFWLSSIQPHEPLGIEAIPQIVRGYARRVLGRTISPHVWRHTCATHLVTNGANIVYVQRLLGHTSLETTQVYTRVSVPDLKKALARAHPRSRRTTAPAPALTREAAAKMQCSHKQTPS